MQPSTALHEPMHEPLLREARTIPSQKSVDKPSHDYDR